MMPDPSVPPHIVGVVDWKASPLVPFNLLPWCWSSEGMNLSKFVGSLRGTAWDSRSFFYLHNAHWFLPEVIGTYSPGSGTLGLATCCGAGTPCSRAIPPEFLSSKHGCGTSPFRVSNPSTSLNGWCFFNSVVVRLPFSSISDSSEWWLFYNLVVILMWLCKEVSCVYLWLPSWPCTFLFLSIVHSFVLYLFTLKLILWLSVRVTIDYFCLFFFNHWVVHLRVYLFIYLFKIYGMGRKGRQL